MAVNERTKWWQDNKEATSASSPPAFAELSAFWPSSTAAE